MSDEIIKITIPGQCVPKGRPRMSRSGSVHTPEATRQYERLVGMYTRRFIKKPIDKGVPLQVGIIVTIEPPASWSKKKKNEAIEGKISYITKPDLDNYIKSVLDGMNKIAFQDDNQIIKLYAEKKYGEHANVEVAIKILE